ncbi:ABC transporter permease [Emticicia sp. BO119]|uniref:ABC transporter permease n=1 Tax=Emticicia sp. BO119 TaxID=2757768 RepID=UPI0015F09B2E|nr:ABC transporter permease [Emticicia sp. BO119]MBA4852995.1 ABC transporter permease [Emticicia sp. BO119]
MKKPGLDDIDSINKDLPGGSSPPQWIHKLLLWFHPEETLEEVTGDLAELYADRIQHSGKFRANLLYLVNVLSVLPPFVRRRTKRKSYYKPSILHRAMLQNYFKIAFRTIAHNKVYSGINVLGLSIGLAAAMLIMLYTKDEVSYDQFHTNNPNIYRVGYDSFTAKGILEEHVGNTGFLQGPIFSASVPEIKEFVRFRQIQTDIKENNNIVSQFMFDADSNFFSVFSFPMLSGNPATALKNPQSIVISEELAERHFGTTDVLGKSIQLKNTHGNGEDFVPHIVTGVTKKCPENSSIKFEALIPLVVEKEIYQNKQKWFSAFLNTFVVLAPNANIKAVENKMNKVYMADAGETIKEMATKYDFHNTRTYKIQQFTDMHLSKERPADNGLKDRSNPMFSYILSGIAVFILLIACINFVNLTVARSLKRAKEIGVRKVVGGGRKQLILQFLGESYLLCFIAFVMALLLVQLVLPTFNQLSNKALALSYLFDFELIAAYIALLLATGLLAGFYPALVLSNYSPVKTLYNRFNLSGKNYLQKGLVILQFSIASFLIIGTMTIYSQFNYLLNKDLGYDDANVISINKSNLSRAEVQVWKEALMQSPNIVMVAPKNGGNWGDGARVNGETEIDFNYETVDGNFLSLLKIPIIKGRNFSSAFPSDSTKAVLVNESFVKKAGWKNPLGQIVDFWYNENDKYQVVGVVKDYHFRDLNREIGPQLFTMKPKNPYGRMYIKIKPGTETTSLAHIEETFKELFPFTPYAYGFIKEQNQKTYESEAKWKQIMFFGAVLTIFISCIGLFGLVTLSAERRMKEIGIRKVLGASVSSIVQLLSSDFLKLVAFSFVFAFPAAYYAISQWLMNYPYRVEINAWLFIGAAVLAIAIALFTVSFQSVRAALVNPVKSLKNE